MGACFSSHHPPDGINRERQAAHEKYVPSALTPHASQQQHKAVPNYTSCQVEGRLHANATQCSPATPPERPASASQGLASRKDVSNSIPKRGVSFAGNAELPGDEHERRKSSQAPKRSASFVGADLHTIMDGQGMLHEGVSRQLSSMSRYSVRSESGNVIIEPEQPKALFELLGLIGRGGFGNIYLADWEGRRVAVKVIQGNCTEVLQSEEQKWEARKERMAQMEAVLMSAIHHPNIVNTFKVTSHAGDDVDADLLLVERRMLASVGVTSPDEGVPSFEWHIIMEYCDKGSLSRELAAFKLHRPLDDLTVGWDAWASLEVLKETVHALMFLHEHYIIHGDLKAANILLASSDQDRRGWMAKVSDFGLSRVMNKNRDMITTRTFGTVTHMPIELLAKGHLLPSSDVYALGVIMWELFTGEKVFKQLSDSAVVLKVVTKKARPIFPSDCPPRYRFLAERCWADMHELRPPLPKVLHELNVLQGQLCPEGQDSPHIPCKVHPTRQVMLGQYRQYLASKEEAAQKAREKAYAHAHVSGDIGNTSGRRSALKSAYKPSHKSLRIAEARFGDQGPAGLTDGATREGVKKGVQDYGVQEQVPTSHKSMHAKMAVVDPNEEVVENSLLEKGRRFKSMTAKRVTSQAPNETTSPLENQCDEPVRADLSLRAKSQSFTAKPLLGVSNPNQASHPTLDLPIPLDNNLMIGMSHKQKGGDSTLGIDCQHCRNTPKCQNERMQTCSSTVSKAFS